MACALQPARRIGELRLAGVQATAQGALAATGVGRVASKAAGLAVEKAVGSKVVR